MLLGLSQLGDATDLKQQSGKVTLLRLFSNWPASFLPQCISGGQVGFGLTLTLVLACLWFASSQITIPSAHNASPTCPSPWTVLVSVACTTWTSYLPWGSGWGWTWSGVCLLPPWNEAIAPRSVSAGTRGPELKDELESDHKQARTTSATV